MITVDDRHWPVVIFRFPDRVTMADLEAYLAKAEQLLDRGGRSAGLVLNQRLMTWDTAIMRRQSEWMKRHADRLREHSLGVALVLTSPLQRGLLKAILWMQPMPQAHHVTADVADALRWIGERLHSAGLDMPAGAREAALTR
jgi:hypothetical protein